MYPGITPPRRRCRKTTHAVVPPCAFLARFFCVVCAPPTPSEVNPDGFVVVVFFFAFFKFFLDAPPPFLDAAPPPPDGRHRLNGDATDLRKSSSRAWNAATHDVSRGLPGASAPCESNVGRIRRRANLAAFALTWPSNTAKHPDEGGFSDGGREGGRAAGFRVEMFACLGFGGATEEAAGDGGGRGGEDVLFGEDARLHSPSRSPLNSASASSSASVSSTSFPASRRRVVSDCTSGSAK